MSRFRFLFPVAALLAACSSSTSPDGGGGPPPPPPPPSPVPSWVAVVAGDNQTAFPGDTVAVRPAVVVRDQNGQALSGATVTFAIEEGGGSLSASTSTTGADGTAKAGLWTLGTAEGPNRLRITVGSLAAVFIAATARLTDVEVTRTTLTTGTVTVNSQGKPFNGATLTIPPGAFAAPASWTFTAIRQGPIANDGNIEFHEWGLRIDTEAGFANRMMVLRLPVTAAENERLIPFLYNPANGRFDLLPVLDMTPTSITIGSRHFSRALMELPEVTPPSSRSVLAAAAAETGATIVLAKMNPAEFPTVSVPFDPIKDLWEFPNIFTPVTPLGLDMGGAISTLHYYRTLRPKLGPLNDRFSAVKGTNMPWDNPGGVRLAAVLHNVANSDFNAAAIRTDIQPFLDAFEARGRSYMNATIVLQVAAALKLTREPVLFAGLTGQRDGVHRAYTFLAYRTTRGDISFSGLGVHGTQTWNPNLSVHNTVGFTDFATLVEERFSVGLPLGTTPIYPMRALDPALWGKFFTHTIGDGDFPDAWIETRRPGHDWARLTGGLHVWSDELEVRTMCAFCPTKRSDIASLSPGVAGQQLVEAYSPTETILGDDHASPLMLETPAVPGERRIGLTMFTFQKARSWHADRPSYLDYTTLAVKSSRLVLDPDTYTATAGREIELTSEIQGAEYAGPGRYEWTFNDGTPVFKSVDASSVKHTWEKTGTYSVELVLIDVASGDTLARDTATVKVVNPVTIWQVTEISLKSSTGDVPDESWNQPSLVTYGYYFRTRDLMEQFTSGRRWAYIHYHDGFDKIRDLYDLDLDGDTRELVHRDESAWLQPGGLPPSSVGERGHWPWPPSIPLAELDIWTGSGFTVDVPDMPKVNFGGTPEQGSLTGRAFAEFGAAPGEIEVNTAHDISALWHGGIMTGTITFTYRAFVGTKVSRTWQVVYSFTAEMLN